MIYPFDEAWDQYWAGTTADRLNGCSYVGKDQPGGGGLPTATFSGHWLHLEFQGKIVVVDANGAVIGTVSTHSWTVDGKWEW
jgi:hypothetical protein